MVSSEKNAASELRVLVIFPGALGDLICFVPALRALMRRHPEASVELMAREGPARFVIERIAPSDGAKAPAHRPRYHSIDRREVSSLFAERETLAPETREFFGQFARIYSFFAHDHPGYRAALSDAAGHPVEFYPFRPASASHVAAAYLASLGEPETALDSGIEAAADVEAARQLLARHALAHDNFVLIHPGSGGRHKNWPIASFVELARRLGGRVPVVIVIGPAEAGLEVAFGAAFQDKGCATMTGLELHQLAGLAQLSRGFIGNDSGVSHLWAACGARGVVIFGPSDPRRWRPLGAIEVLHREPLTTLSVDEVFAAAAEHFGWQGESP